MAGGTELEFPPASLNILASGESGDSFRIAAKTVLLNYYNKTIVLKFDFYSRFPNQTPNAYLMFTFFSFVVNYPESV